MSFVYLFFLATGQVSERLKMVYCIETFKDRCIYIHGLLIFWLYNSKSFYFSCMYYKWNLIYIIFWYLLF